MNYLSNLSNYFGLTNGKIFNEPPSYVDKEKRPGSSGVPKPTIMSWLSNSPFLLINSPNFVWSIIALFIYFCFPYNLTNIVTPISYSFITTRFPMWFTTVFGYTAFWHICLYFFNLSSRPFIANRPYNINKVVHNIFWNTSGIFIWTIFENIFCYLWSSNRLLYINDIISFNTPNGLLKFVIALMAIPIWRSFHFYFAHRLLHFSPLYQQVHSLHHRNTDTEPFSGLCMHPIEHLYYYSCILPSLFIICSPFAFLWNGVHLLLSPAASHSGWEDHFQSDAYHYLHHRYFECNYSGTDTAFLDIMFGTFRGSLSEEDKCEPRDDAKSNLFTVPTNEFILYLSSSLLCIGTWGYCALQVANKVLILSNYSALGIASLVGFGPVILACLFKNTKAHPVKMTIIGNLIHLLVGSLFCSVPITYMCWLTLI
jgi:sterol desaturase/sphingolipid hydroxylase (fatty acid hydroxylase superfamily)